MQSVVSTVKVDEACNRFTIVYFDFLHFTKDNTVSAMADSVNYLAIKRYQSILKHGGARFQPAPHRSSETLLHTDACTKSTR